MKLALHRSLIFWAGILVMGFIGWAWRDSYRRESWLFVGRACFFGNFAGGVMVNRWEGHSDFGVSHAPIPARYEFMQWFPPPHFLHGDLKPPFEEPKIALGDGLIVPGSLREYQAKGMLFHPEGDQQWFVPHWLTLAVVVAVWAALLGWRARRRSRMTNGEFPNVE